MIPYAQAFESLRARAATWASGDMDAHVALEEQAPRLDPDEEAEFVSDFCAYAGVHVEEIGADAVGDVIWYLMGSGWQVWFDAASASKASAEGAVLSLRVLYESCFAIHLTDWKGAGVDDRRLSTACYMLWDMDGGLETVPLFNEPRALVPACYAVLEHALSLDSPACWESALHGLGHIAFRHREPAQGLIDAFLDAKRDRIPEDLQRYARDARSGGVQ